MARKKVKSDGFEPVKVVDLGNFTVNYDETIDQKLAANPRTSWDRRFPTDQLFPDNRKGKATYAMSIVGFDEIMYPLDSVEKWCKKNKKKLASPKEALDLLKHDPGAASAPKILWISGQIGEDPRLGQFELVCNFLFLGGPILLEPIMAIGYAINLRWYLALGKPSKNSSDRSKP